MHLHPDVFALQKRKAGYSFIQVTIMAHLKDKLGQVLKHQRPTTGLFKRIAFPQGKKHEGMRASYILFVRDVSVETLSFRGTGKDLIQ